MPITILAIESSCDDTAAAIVRDGAVLSNVVASQAVHQAYGGVVPELASRSHQEHIVPTVSAALERAGVGPGDLSAVAFTRGPGLIGSLLVGVSFAKAYAFALGLPIIEVHHMHAHVLAHLAEPPRPAFPFLCLTVSGGHTQIVRVDSPLSMHVLGRTIDDAAGEAFDKIGKMLGLDYPAGPHIDRLAQHGEARFSYGEPQMPGLDYSFSGLKTSVLYDLRKRKNADPGFVAAHLADICASVQAAIVRILMKKLEEAAEQTGIRDVAIAGGVSANSGLRRALLATGDRLGWRCHIPDFQYCTDNAGMIGVAAHYKYLAGEFAALDTMPDPRLPF